MAALTSDWRQMLRNPLRPDGAWKNVERLRDGVYRGYGSIDGRKNNLPQRPTPGLAAVDVDKVLYKQHGAGTDDNGTLTPEVMAALDGLTLEQVVAGIKASGGSAFSRGSSAFRGVDWIKGSSTWRAQIRTADLGGCKTRSKCFEVEEDAAHQYDAWARELGRGVDELNFPQPADYVAAGLPVPASLGSAAGTTAALAAGGAAAAAGPGPFAGTAAAPRAAPLPLPLPAAAAAAPGLPAPTTSLAAAASVGPTAAADSSSSHIAHLAARLASPEEYGWVDSEDDWSDEDAGAGADEDDEDDDSCTLDTSHSAGGISGISAGAAALITAYLQLHGDGPIPPEALAVFGVPHTAIPQQPAAAAGAQPAATGSAVQFDGERLRLKPGLQGLIGNARRWRGTNVVSLDVTGVSSSTSKQQQQQQQQAGSSAAASAAAGSSGSGPPHTRPVTTLVLESVAAPAAADSALLQAAMCQAAVEVTQAPRVIRAAAKAAAAWGGEVPQQLVYDIEAGIRFAASREIRRLRPGNSHYWRGTATWQRLIDDDANNKAVAAAAVAAGRSPPRVMTPQETAAAASAIAFKAASPHDAAEACVAAAAAAGRSCTAPDLHAAWLAQRLGAGEFRVEVSQPAVDMAVLEQAFRDNEVQPIPSIDYEPVPGLDPELVWPTPDDDPTASSCGGGGGGSPAAAIPPAAAAPREQQQQPGGMSAGFDLSAALASAQEHWAKAEAPYSAETDKVPFDQQDSRDDDDEEYEEAWMLEQLRQHAAAAAAAAPGNGAAAGFVAAAAAAGPAAGSMVEGVGLLREGRAQVAQQVAEVRRQGHDMRGFDKANIPSVDLPLTGDAMADTVTLLQAIVAEGDADHLPSHVRSYRIAKMVQQVMPSWDADSMVEALGRPLEGDYCPVVLAVPPPDPSLPARAAAAAATAAAAAGYAPLVDDFDPVNRLPPQALALPGCSHRGHVVAARRAAAAGAAAAAASGVTEPRVSDSNAPAGNVARMLSMAHGGALVSLLRPLQPEDSRQPGGGWPRQEQQQQQGSNEAGSLQAGCAAAAGGGGGLGGTTAGFQAGMAAALTAAAQLPCGEQFAAGSVAAAKAAAVAADTLAAASAAPAAISTVGLTVAQQPEGRAWLNPVLLAAATTAPVLCAGAESHTYCGEAAVIGTHAPAAVLQSAAEAATVAAVAALQPCPMQVDWVADEDMASELGMWAPAEQLAGSRMDAARQAAKDQAAAAAAAGKALNVPDEEMADVQAGSSSRGNGGGAAPQQQQPTIITGFIMADSHPGIDAAHAAALGLRMPRPLASMHTYQPGTPAAEAAAAAVRALVLGEGLTFCTTVPPPADQPAAHSGSDGQDTTISSSPLDNFVDPPDGFGAELVCAAAAAAVGTGDAAAAEACVLVAEQGDVLALPFYPAAGSLHDTSRLSFKQIQDAQRAKAEASAVRVQHLELLSAADSQLMAAIDAGDGAEVAAATAARDAALMRLHGCQSATEASDVWVDSWEQYTVAGTAAAESLHIHTIPATNPVFPQATGGSSSAAAASAPTAAAASTTAAPGGSGAPPAAAGQQQHEGSEHRVRVSMALARGLQIMAACNAAEAAAKARGVSDPQQLQAVEEAAIGRRVLSGVPGNHHSHAVLAARAGRRMQSELLGVENPPDDVFDCCFQVQTPPPGFYQRVRRGEVGAGDQGLALDERCVPLEEVLDYSELPHEACKEAWARDRRFREERDIVRAARHHVLIAMTTPPDGMCYKLVAGAEMEIPGMSFLDVAVRAQMIMRGEA